jgi:hypothetical protein
MDPRRGSRILIRAIAALAVGSIVHSPTLAQSSFSDNEFVTWSDVGWGGIPASGNISDVLEKNFNSVFASTNDLMQIGIPGNAGHSIIFDSADAVIAYLPANGTPSSLTVTLLDPVQTSAGSLGSQVAALDLNVAFNDAGLLKGNSNVLFGNLVLTGFTNDLAFLNGMTVRGLLSEANNILGGGPTPDPTLSFEDFDGVLLSVNDSFNGGPAFASFDDQHLQLPPSTTAAPEIDRSSVLSEMTLLLGALAVLRGRASARRKSRPSTPTCYA